MGRKMVRISPNGQRLQVKFCRKPNRGCSADGFCELTTHMQVLSAKESPRNGVPGYMATRPPEQRSGKQNHADIRRSQHQTPLTLCALLEKTGRR